MKMKKLSLLAAALVTAAVPFTGARAAIIDNSSYLTDTATGLDWLDVTTSVNLSYNYVSSQFGAGQQFDGWRYATRTEFNAFLTNYGISSAPHDITNPSSDQLALHNSIINSMGATGGGPLDHYFYGILSDANSFQDHLLGYVYASNNTTTHATAYDALCCADPAVGNSFYGSLLVRTHVAVPGPIAGAGLPGLIFAGGLLAWWRRKRTMKLAT